MSIDNIIIKLNNLIKLLELKKKNFSDKKNISSHETREFLKNTYKTISDIIDTLETRKKK